MAGAYPLAGANVLLRDATPKFKLGTPLIDDSNQTWVYVEAGETHAEDARVDLTDFVTSADEAGAYQAVSAITEGEYGWVQKFTPVL